MGREVRRVPPGWEHPRGEDGQYKSMFDRSFSEAVSAWKEAFAAWERGERPEFYHAEDYPDGLEYWEWDGGPPDREYYMPPMDPVTRTHYQMYQTTSEGTPISPVFATPEEMCRWCADNKASYFGGEPAPYETWWGVYEGTMHGFMVMVAPALAEAER